MKRLLRLLTLAAVVTAVAAALRRRRQVHDATAALSPTPWPPLEDQPAAEPAAPLVTPDWVEPGSPDAAEYPIKAKTSSGIFHVPGGASYDRTTPDRLYRSEAAAEADGLRKAQR